MAVIKRVFLRVSDLSLLNDYSLTSASREMQVVRAILGKQKIKVPYIRKSKIRFKYIWQKITIDEYCELMGIPVDYIKERLEI